MEARTSARVRPGAAVALLVTLVGLAIACTGVLLQVVPAAAQKLAPPSTSPTQHILSAYNTSSNAAHPRPALHSRAVHGPNERRVPASGIEGLAGGSANAAEALPTLEIDAARMPNIARNVQSALDEGHPGVLNRTMDTDLMRMNRAEACRGFCGPGSPDEYPFASTLQGGAGARVAGVPLGEQYIQGAVIRNFYAKFGIGDGDPFRVVVTGLEP